jgi:hypothetical protein
MHVMKRALVQIALVLALSLGLVAEGRAITPGIPSCPAGTLVSGVAACGVEPILVQNLIYVQSNQYGKKKAGGANQLIPPSAALQAAMRYAPGSKGLGVRLLQGPRLMYAVKLKTGDRVRRVLIDARTGQVLGE